MAIYAAINYTSYHNLISSLAHACEIWQIKHRLQEVWKLSGLIDVWNRKCVLELLFTVSLVSFWPKMEFLSSRSWRCIGNVLSTGRVQPKLGREVDYTKIWNIPWEVKVLHKTRWNHWQQFPLDLFWFFYFLYFYIWRSIGNMLPTGRVQSKLEYNDSL